MRKNTFNFIVDSAGLLVMLAMIVTGLWLKYILPPGSRGGRGLELWGLDRHQWGDIHFWLAVTLLALMVLHVILHWEWVCVTVRRCVLRGGAGLDTPPEYRQNLYGLGFFLVVVILVTGFLVLANTQVTKSSAGEHERGQRRGRQSRASDLFEEPDHLSESSPGRGGGNLIRGSTTLVEAASLAGISIEQFADELGLPADVDPQQGLGQLRRTYGFEMSTVRRLVDEHRAGEPEP
ncbi:MAG: DUF4405 domain-containing protein [Planctomycetota bacterium]